MYPPSTHFSFLSFLLLLLASSYISTLAFAASIGFSVPWTAIETTSLLLVCSHIFSHAFTGSPTKTFVFYPQLPVRSDSSPAVLVSPLCFLLFFFSNCSLGRIGNLRVSAARIRTGQPWRRQPYTGTYSIHFNYSNLCRIADPHLLLFLSRSTIDNKKIPLAVRAVGKTVKVRVS